MRSLVCVVAGLTALACGPNPSTSTGQGTGGADVPDGAKDVDGAVDDGPAADGEGIEPCTLQTDGAPCEDADPCTTDDQCSGGVCVGGANLVCDAEGSCREGTCEAGIGCQYTDREDAAPCAISCFGEAFCFAGECQAEADSKIPCPQPTDPCVLSLECDTQTGLCTVPIVAAPGTACDSDDDICTLESCNEAGACAASGTETCEQQQKNNPCWTWSCNKKTGCAQTLFVEGVSCSDNNPCTSNDACQILGGQKVCLGTPLPIDDLNPCTDDACVDGTVIHTPVDGVPCNLDQGCAAGACSDGVCVAAGECCESPADCPAPGECYAAACTAGVCGVEFTPGQPCTGGTCTAGACVAGPDCLSPGDCAVGGVCKAPTCTDGECGLELLSGVDCPGGTCQVGLCVPELPGCDGADPTAPVASLPPQGYDLAKLNAQYDYAATPTVLKLFSTEPVTNIDAMIKLSDGSFSIVPNEGDDLEALYHYSSTGTLLWETATGINGAEITLAEAADGATLAIGKDGTLKHVAGGVVTVFGPPGHQPNALVQLPNGNVGMAGTIAGDPKQRVWELDRTSGAVVQALSEDYPGSLNIAVGPGGWLYTTTSGPYALQRSPVCGSFSQLAVNGVFIEGAVALPNNDVLLAALSEGRLDRFKGGSGVAAGSIDISDSPRQVQLHPNGKVYVAGYSSVYELSFPCKPGSGLPGCAVDPPETIDVPITVSGFDVSDDGSMTVAAIVGNQVQAVCYGAGGIVTKGAFTVATMESNAKGGWNGAYVARADVSHHSVIAAHVSVGENPGGDPSTWRLFFLDPDCNLVKGPVDLQPLGAEVTMGSTEYFDLTMSDMGRAAAVYVTDDVGGGNKRNDLAVFHADGTPVAAPVSFGGAGLCNLTYGIRVAMRGPTGDLVVTCQNHQSGPVRYQRFTKDVVPLDATVVAVGPSESNKSSWYDSHTLGMDETGHFVVVYQQNSTSTLRAAFYAPSGAFVTETVVGSISQGYDGYRRRHAPVQARPGGGFVVPQPHGAPSIPCATAFSAAGAPQTVVSPPECRLLRIDAAMNAYIAPKSGPDILTQSLLP